MIHKTNRPVYQYTCQVPAKPSQFPKDPGLECKLTKFTWRSRIPKPPSDKHVEIPGFIFPLKWDLQKCIQSLYMCAMFLCVHTSENIYMQHTISFQLATNSSQIARNIIVILPTQHLLATCKYKQGKFVHLSVTGSKVMNNLTQQRPDLPDGL